MGKFLAAAAAWFRGKKTILGGGLVMAAAVAGVWYGRLDADMGLAVLGAGLSIAGYAAKANRHQAELLGALEVISQAGADVRAGKPPLSGIDIGTLIAPCLPVAGVIADGKVVTMGAQK